MRKLFCGAVSIFVISASPFVAPSFAESSKTYKVVDVASNDVLNIRAGGSMSYSIVGIIPPNGRGVTIVGPCDRGWCVIDYQSTRGWVNTKHLALEGEVHVALSCRVVGVASNDVLNVRNGPSASHKIVGFIPPDGTGVDAEGEDGAKWWRVQYKGVSGWANMDYLACRF